MGLRDGIAGEAPRSATTVRGRNCAQYALRTALVAAVAVVAAACEEAVHDAVEVRQGDCYTCHVADYEGTANPPHAGLFGKECADCHDTSHWVPAVGFGAHEWFPLTEGHAEVECASCHTNGYREGDTSSECVSCHRPDYDRSPYPGHNVFPLSCTDCHTTEAWKPSSWMHAWELTGAHVGTECAGCHTGDPPVYDGTPTDCVSCHRGDFDRAPDTHQGHELYPTTCVDCHSTATWRSATFTHEWPIDGAHSWTPCARCHVGDPPVYEGTPTECSECHIDDYERSTYPGHNVFPLECRSCHGTTTWVPSSFVHEWPLEGAHVGTPCESCHVGEPPVYEGTASQCIDCHADDYAWAPMTHAGHEAYPTTCTDCHTASSWRDADFVHPWPLRGAHGATPCSACHTGTPPSYAGTSTDCVSCHRADYDRSTHPGHDAYPTTCTDCHTETAWRPATFAHSWPLTGAHAGTGCASCHTGSPPVYAGTPTDCVSCHRADYDASPFPGHEHFATTCADCHSTTAFRPATFTHSWPISGAHAGATCLDCHGDPPTWAGTSTACVGCHRDDYDRAVATVSGHGTYSTTCTDCHSNTAWTPSSFTHPWPLIGSHESAACESCHTGTPPRYAGTTTDCNGCHAADYSRAATILPAHSTFPRTCGDCHNTFDFRGATFSHSWPLVGGHSRAPCGSCHTGSPPVYTGTPTDCNSCHAADAAASPYLPHPTFGATCADCHTPVGFSPASNGYHSESTFRITSGRHARPCTPCHVPALGDWWGGANTNCADGGCHEHSPSSVNGEHSGETGFPVSGPVVPSTFCMGCHEHTTVR